jgi:hypothetical protein
VKRKGDLYFMPDFGNFYYSVQRQNVLFFLRHLFVEQILVQAEEASLNRPEEGVSAKNSTPACSRIHTSIRS